MLLELLMLLHIVKFNIDSLDCIVKALGKPIHDSLLEGVSELSSLCNASNENDLVSHLLPNVRIFISTDAFANQLVEVHWLLHLLIG